MNLAVEDIKILYYLLNQDEYVTSDELSSFLLWNPKKIQQMLNSLNYEISEYGYIESRKNKGYRLIIHSDEDREKLIEQIISFGNIDQTLEERRVCIILYLLFSKGYKSMDAIAEDLYISKTTVFEEIGNIKRWFDRIDELQIEVSPIKGSAITGDEFSKRYLCANLIGKGVLSKIGISEEYQKRYDDIVTMQKERISEYLLTNSHIISGEQYNVMVKFVSVSILRNEMGFYLNDESGECKDDNIDDYYNQLFGLLNTDEEKAEENKRKIADNISEKIGYDVTDIFNDNSMKELDYLFMPNTTNLHNVNYYDKQIIKSYPLEVHLINRAFHESLGWLPSRSDLLMIAYLLGIGLRKRKYYRKKKVILIGDVSIGVLMRNVSYLKELLPFEPEIFEIKPSYEFEVQKDDVLDGGYLIFTHQYDLKLKYSQMIYVPAIISKDSEQKLKEEISSFVRRELLQDLDKMIANASRRTLDKTEGLREIISDDDLKSATPLMYEKNSLCLILEDEKNKISVTSLKKEVKKENHFIKKIIVVRYDRNDIEKQYYFEQIKLLLN